MANVSFFFFQAEDGIRDKLVTGVQTCALPILSDRASKGLYDDLGGPALKKAADGYGWKVAAEALVADEKREIQRAIREQVNKGCERSEEHTSELQSLAYLVCRLLLEKKKKKKQ